MKTALKMSINSYCACLIRFIFSYSQIILNIKLNNVNTGLLVWVFKNKKEGEREMNL